MKFTLLATTIMFGIATTTAFADDPPPPPRTHVDTTVVGSDAAAGASGPSEGSARLDNDHHFEAGAPDLLKITGKLNLSSQQQGQLNDTIERADAGAAVLIKREHDLVDMIAATTPQDPLYAQLIAEQAASAGRWSENRDNLRREVMAILSPTQRARFEELQAAR
jgi:Spy/CpxP family protein refolding chaperone